MPRVLSLYLPTWSADLARRRLSRTQPSPPPSETRLERTLILLVEISRGQQVVARCCHRSAALGVAPGMTLTHARARLPAQGLHVEPYRPARDRAALHALAQWVMRFTPRLALDDDGLLLDITGCQRLFRGEQRLVGRVAAAVQRLGFAACVASAPTYGCAWALARGLTRRAAGRARQGGT